MQLTGNHSVAILCQSLTRMSAVKSHAEFLLRKNSKFKNWHGRQFLNRIISATDGGVQKTNDVCVSGQFWATPKTEVESVSKSKVYFETLSYKLEVQKLTRTSIFEPQCDYLAFALIQVARIKIQRILIRAVYKLCRLQRLGNACKNGSHLLQCSYV